jgi:hypothetical protein
MDREKNYTHDDVRAFIDNGTMSVTHCWSMREKKDASVEVGTTTPLIFGSCHCKGK